MYQGSILRNADGRILVQRDLRPLKSKRKNAGKVTNERQFAFKDVSSGRVHSREKALESEMSPDDFRFRGRVNIFTLHDSSEIKMRRWFCPWQVPWMCSRNQAVDLLPAPSVSEVHPGMFAQKRFLTDQSVSQAKLSCLLCSKAANTPGFFIEWGVLERPDLAKVDKVQLGLSQDYNRGLPSSFNVLLQAVTDTNHRLGAILSAGGYTYNRDFLPPSRNSCYSCLLAVTSVVSDSLRPHGILQEKILEGVAISSFRASPQPRDQTSVSCLLLWQVGSLPYSHRVD